jgi:peptidoglycan hydrolase CwlO-like protein
MDTEKIIRAILRNANDRNKPVKKTFKFNLLKLITKQTPEIKTKIKNAIDNESGWDKNNIQSLSMNALQDLFFNIIDYLKIETPGYEPGECCIQEKYLEAILSGYFEDKKDLEKEIEELRDQSITIQEHDNEIKKLKKEHKQVVEDLNRQIEKLESTESFLRERIEKSEPRIRKQVELEFQAKNLIEQSTD